MAMLAPSMVKGNQRAVPLAPARQLSGGRRWCNSDERQTVRRRCFLHGEDGGQDDASAKRHAVVECLTLSDSSIHVGA